MKKFILVIILLSAFGASLYSQTMPVGELSKEIKEEELREAVSFLASDELEGRLTGEEGARIAADFIAEHFSKLGLMPLGDKNDYFYPFEFIKKVEVKQAGGLKINGIEKALTEDYYPASFSASGKMQGEVVFAGYGIKHSDTHGFSYNSYAGLDIQDKIVAILDDMPDSLSKEQRKELTLHARPIYKAVTAKSLGAKGLIILTNEKQLYSGSKSQDFLANSGIPVVRFDRHLTSDLFIAAGTTTEEVKSTLNKMNPHLKNTFAVPDYKVEVEVQIDKVYETDNNVVGLLPAEGSDEYILIGAHYDHLGRGEVNSLATDAERHAIHRGADDNASGTALVMEMAEHFALLKRESPELLKVNLVFILWSGEEIGLIGSSAFAEELPMDTSQVLAYFNFDMVGMLKDRKLILQGMGSADIWEDMFKKLGEGRGFELSLNEDPYVPTDAMSLYKAGVPSVSFFTGLTDYYHKPSDSPETLNYIGMKDIGDFANFAISHIMANDIKPQYKKVLMTTGMSRNRGFSVSLGTIPDYAGQDIVGLKLSGVRENGPAHKAGLLEGDIITKLAGKEISNIYDFTYALGEMEAGKKYDVTVNRNGKSLSMTIVPTEKSSNPH